DRADEGGAAVGRERDAVTEPAVADAVVCPAGERQRVVPSADSATLWPRSPSVPAVSLVASWTNGPSASPCAGATASPAATNRSAADSGMPIRARPRLLRAR